MTTKKKKFDQYYCFLKHWFADFCIAWVITCFLLRLLLITAHSRNVHWPFHSCIQQTLIKPPLRKRHTPTHPPRLPYSFPDSNLPAIGLSLVLMPDIFEAMWLSFWCWYPRKVEGGLFGNYTERKEIIKLKIMTWKAEFREYINWILSSATTFSWT